VPRLFRTFKERMPASTATASAPTRPHSCPTGPLPDRPFSRQKVSPQRTRPVRSRGPSPSVSPQRARPTGTTTPLPQTSTGRTGPSWAGPGWAKLNWDWTGLDRTGLDPNKTRPGRTGPQSIQPEHGKTGPGRTEPNADRNHPEGSNKKIRAACPSTYGPARIKAPSDPICAEVLHRSDRQPG